MDQQPGQGRRRRVPLREWLYRQDGPTPGRVRTRHGSADHESGGGVPWPACPVIPGIHRWNRPCRRTPGSRQTRVRSGTRRLRRSRRSDRVRRRLRRGGRMNRRNDGAGPESLRTRARRQSVPRSTVDQVPGMGHPEAGRRGRPPPGHGDRPTGRPPDAPGSCAGQGCSVVERVEGYDFANAGSSGRVHWGRAAVARLRPGRRGPRVPGRDGTRAGPRPAIALGMLAVGRGTDVALPPDGRAGSASARGQARRHPRLPARGRRQDGPGHPRTGPGCAPVRRGRRAAPLPGHRRVIRKEEHINTRNIGSSRWGTILAYALLAVAIIDRIVHHGRLVGFTGPSRRIGEALISGKEDRRQSRNQTLAGPPADKTRKNQ